MKKVLTSPESKRLRGKDLLGQLVRIACRLKKTLTTNALSAILCSGSPHFWSELMQNVVHKNNLECTKMTVLRTQIEGCKTHMTQWIVTKRLAATTLTFSALRG